MACIKCNYKDKNKKIIFSNELCLVCSHFAPENPEQFKNYINEKLDWRILDTFRKFNQKPGQKQKQGMNKQAQKGHVVTRPPLGYDLIKGRLIPNQEASKVHHIFKSFLETPLSFNKFSKQNNISFNGMKKILTNRTYLGEIKFSGNLYKGKHKPIISPEIFYAVQRKINH